MGEKRERRGARSIVTGWVEIGRLNISNSSMKQTINIPN